jgi:hypothetical protein
MKFTYDDGGRADAGYKGNAGDCVVRAVAIASGLPYAEVYEALSGGMKTQRTTKRSKARSSARDGVNVRRKWFRDYMARLGFKWTPTMQIGSGCKVHLHDGELPMGKLIVSVSKHYTAVIDGVIHDTHDPQRDVHCSRPLGNGNPPLRADEFTHDGKWAHKISRRCVYGYWEAA